MTRELSGESVHDVRAHPADITDRADRDNLPTALDEREINRIIDRRMSDPGPGIPIEEIIRETLARNRTPPPRASRR
ncbi:prevent-host-death protein [Streptomyces sp. NBC_01190]|uniref:prevent-host-death protein n=1 Tax=Streptomyces sp. NBC_01190 TaxID=2903767 RepID=UPI003870C554|nr:prevent-host-death protein [Streptomyces sp. NBC_01190]